LRKALRIRWGETEDKRRARFAPAQTLGMRR
jgi:hypothetical protein